MCDNAAIVLTLRNPHSILAALQTRHREVTELRVVPRLENDASSAWSQVIREAKARGVRVTSRAPEKSEKVASADSGGRVGIGEALVKERNGIPVEELFADAAGRAEGKGLWLALDTLQDPHNVGAIFRAAGFFGVEGILLTEERSAPLSAAAYDVASGGMEYVPFTRQTNLQRAFEEAKRAGLWILGTSEHAETDLHEIKRDRPWLLVLGNEEKGMRRLTEESCDVVCRIAPRGKVTSLNVSVAAGILISALSPRP